ncbi:MULTISPECIES: hypothetical protein [Streptomyces]|uniref:hypothetical protein n=1 Tax=Streptomyces TaxID=1883 RepID=UPI00224947D4|nr:hypothetical protein [Streptomyces sp. JHD 1]MCX2969247.1 hypothetical protein [Streptomyces sp. JHD 1]
MASHARHARPRTRQLLRAGLTLSAAAAAALGTAGPAQADATVPDAVGMATGSLGTALGNTLVPVTDLRLYPLAGTGTDPLANSIGTQVADFKPVSTAPVTAPVTEGGASLDTLTGPVTALLGPLATG